MTQEEKNKVEEEFELQLREMKHWYGSWEELLKVIDYLQDNDNEAAWERHMNDYESASQQEVSEKNYKQKYS